MLTSCWIIMANQDSDSAVSFDFCKLLTQPSKMIGRVDSLTNDPPVKTVANICVVSNQSRSVWHYFAIIESDLHWVVSVLAEGLKGLWSQPVSPRILEMVNRPIDVWFAEVLDIHRPSIMVALNRKHGNVGISELRFNLLGNCNRIVSYFFNCVVPDVVGRVVTSPDEHVWLNFCFNVRQHALKGMKGKIALWATPFTSSNIAGLSWITNIGTAAQVSITVSKCSLSILKVQVGVWNVDSKIGLTNIWICCNLSV